MICSKLQPMIVAMAVVAALTLSATLAMSGCAAPSDGGNGSKPSAGSAPSGTGSSTAGKSAPGEDAKAPAPDKVVVTPLSPNASKPGLTKLGDGTAKAVGTLQLRQIEGDIWVVVDSVPGPGAAKANVLVVISDPELFDMGSLNGFYVAAQGALGTGASTSMAGPQMIANTIVKVGYPK